MLWHLPKPLIRRTMVKHDRSQGSLSRKKRYVGQPTIRQHILRPPASGKRLRDRVLNAAIALVVLPVFLFLIVRDYALDLIIRRRMSRKNENEADGK